ncbi:MAG: RAD55 family ATPase [Candidatus Hydrothermarchaeaceae archaeon]
MIEFPQTYNALLIGLPGVGKGEYCAHLAKGYLEKGEKVAYVATEKRPSDIRKRMKELGVDLEAHEGESFLFIDVFTRTAGEKEEKVLYVDNPSNLNLVSVKISEAHEVLGKPLRIIFDSLSTFFLHAPETEIRSFFESITTKIKMDGSFALFTLHEEMHDEKMVIALKAMVQSVLEMDIEDTPARKTKVRVAIAKEAVPHSVDWFEFKIEKEGFKLGPKEEVKAPREKAEAKRKLPLAKIAGVVALLLLAVVVFPGMFEKERDMPVISQAVTAAPPLIADGPTSGSSGTTLPAKTKEPPIPISEFRLDGMEDIGNWYPMEGGGAFLDIAESTEFSKVGKSMKVSIEIVSAEDSYAFVGLSNPDLAGYDGVTIWSYVPEPIPLGRLSLSLEEEGGARYTYMRMRNLKRGGWIKDTIPFADIRKDPWGNVEDENGRLDIDQVKFLSINVGGGPGSDLGIYVFYLDELNLFRYQNVSEQR